MTVFSDFSLADWLGIKKKPPELKILHRVRSRFNHIYVIQNGREREMWFKGEGTREFFLQGRVNLDRKHFPNLVYSRTMLASLLLCPAPRRVLLVGLGGGMVSNFLHRYFPQTEIDVVEVDPRVVEVTQKYFFMKPGRRYRVHMGDGRVFVQSLKGKGQFDLVFLDAYKSGSIPFHLKTRQFYEEIRDILAPEGVVISNLYGKSNLLKPGDHATFAAVFRQLYLFEDIEKIATVLLATNQGDKWIGEDFIQAAAKFPASFPLPMNEIARFFQSAPLYREGMNMFIDDFRQEDFKQVVELNNADGMMHPPYPIQNSD